MTCNQCRISALVSQTSFRRETSGGVAKCRLFSQVRARETSDAIAYTTNTRKDLINVSLLISRSERKVKSYLLSFQNVNKLHLFLETSHKFVFLFLEAFVFRQQLFNALSVLFTRVLGTR